MELDIEEIVNPKADPVSNVLKWILLGVAVVTFSLMAWATTVTYRTTPPQPERFVTRTGAVVMSGGDIFAGKGGFQKADLMDFGSLYGMGSYYGPDYTAATLVSIGKATENAIAAARYGRPLAMLTADETAAVKAEMQRDLKGIDLTERQVVLPDAVVSAIGTVQQDLARSLNSANPAEGWTPAYSLHGPLGLQTADFLVFSALTTVARRPGTDISWTQNWPYEPLVGNAPTPSTFIWNLGELLLHLPVFRAGAVHLRNVSQPPR